MFPKASSGLSSPLLWGKSPAHPAQAGQQSPVSSWARRRRWKRKISFGCKSHEKYIVEKCLEGWGMVIKCSNKKEQKIPELIRQQELHRPTHGQHWRGDTVPAMPQLSGTDGCCSKTCTHLSQPAASAWLTQMFLSPALPAADRLSNESMCDWLPPNLPPPLCRQCQQLTEVVTAT